MKPRAQRSKYLRNSSLDFGGTKKIFLYEKYAIFFAKFPKPFFMYIF